MKYRRARRAAWRNIAGETILLDLEGKRMYGLNATAAAIWQLLEAVAEVSDLARVLDAGQASHAVGPREIESFLQELLNLALVEAAEPEKVKPTAIEPPANLETPKILWQETVEQVAASCAFFPATNPLCNQVPFS